MTSYHRYRRYHLHGLRVLFLGISLIGLFLLKVETPTIALKAPTEQVLAYATNISRADLLTYTNQARAQNGLPPLTLNAKLNTSSQNKAQDMITYDYWAHTSPSGVEPWYWFDQAGYTYSAAGENLAYGFDTSSGVVNGWMNSASHRANVLGSYVDVGFGIANGENYQGGPNTVVVAHYGTPQAAAPAPAPAPAPPAPASTTTSTPTAPSPPPAAPAPEVPSAPTEPVQPIAQTPAAPVASAMQPQAAKPVSAPPTKNINLLEGVKTGSAPAYSLVSLVLLVTSAVGFLFTHRALFQHALITSEVYVMKHPMMDIAAIGAISMLALSTSVSHI